MNYAIMCFATLFCCVLQAQNKQIDSLKVILSSLNLKSKSLVSQASSEDTIKVNILNNLSKKLNTLGSYDSALLYANEAKTLALALGFKRGAAKAYNNIGIVYKYQANYPEALKNYLIVLTIWKDIGDKKGIAYANGNMGNIYSKQGNYTEALKNHFACLKIFEECNDKHGIANCFTNIGNVYYQQENYSESLKNYEAALKIQEEIGDKEGIAGSYNNIGEVYRNQNNLNEALKSQQAALKIHTDIETEVFWHTGGTQFDQIFSHNSSTSFVPPLYNYKPSLHCVYQVNNGVGTAGGGDQIQNTTRYLERKRKVIIIHISFQQDSLRMMHSEERL